MNQIEQIKKELAEISPWPWELKALWPPAVEAHLLVFYSNEPTDFSQFKTEADAKWFKESPERIAALVEYVEASEQLAAIRLLHRVFDKPAGKNFRAVYERYKAARRKLGLEP